MPSTNTYKEARICECGYTTSFFSAWSTHKKRCRLVTNEKDERIESLEKQLAAKDDHYQRELAAKDQQMKEQLAAKDEQLAEKDKQINQLIPISQLGNDHKAKRQKSETATERKMKMTEPQRRIIAARQDWKCANPDGKCRLKDGYLEEYDVDHIIPLRIGGPDHSSNMQALCPACHRRKTERDVRLVVPETFELETFQTCGINTLCQPCVS